MLGSVDSNTGSPDLGWDTDQFPMDVKNTTLVMKVSLLLLCHVWAEVGSTEVQIVRGCESVSRFFSVSVPYIIIISLYFFF